MTDFVISLADVPIAVSALHESTRDFCGGWLVDEPARERIVLTQDDIESERRYAAEQNVREGLRVRSYGDAYLETLALYRRAASVLLRYDTVVFHGAVLAVGERAYLFTAPSGTGKTTHARFWLAQVPGCYVLNGDKPLLRIGDSDVVAYGTPWMGKEGMGVNGFLPLAGLCVLRRDDHDHIERLDAREALSTIIAQSHRPKDPMGLVRVVELAGRMGSLVPLWQMGCTLDERSALMSWRAMCGLADAEA
ncbi:MAG: hypothetical protein J6S63_06080 [Atopobiaceae bacterium]|nr:hypothetical protein [Atopobiaceae bacterium]